MGFLREHGTGPEYDDHLCGYRDERYGPGTTYKCEADATVVMINTADWRDARPRCDQHQPVWTGFDVNMNPDFLVVPFEQGTASQLRLVDAAAEAQHYAANPPIHIYREELGKEELGSVEELASVDLENVEWETHAVCGVISEANTYQYATLIELARERGTTEGICQECLINLLSVVLVEGE